jgi:hypothetical protein
VVAPGNHFKALVGPVVKHQRARTDFLSTRDHGRLKDSATLGLPLRKSSARRCESLFTRISLGSNKPHLSGA